MRRRWRWKWSSNENVSQIQKKNDNPEICDDSNNADEDCDGEHQIAQMTIVKHDHQGQIENLSYVIHLKEKYVTMDETTTEMDYLIVKILFVEQ